jgi:quercetin dioxygenase-like cupin family protein
LASEETKTVALRRIVTGHDVKGRAVVAEIGTPPRSHAFQHIPGMAQTVVWATPAVPALPHEGSDPTPSLASIVPGPGETRLLVVSFPPDAVFMAPGFDGQAAQMENLAVSPGLAELFEPDGMHQTPTVDYGIVLDGEIWLELDDGRSERLTQHDIVVQNGTRHAWRNRSNRPATLAFVLVGAARGR